MLGTRKALGWFMAAILVVGPLVLMPQSFHAEQVVDGVPISTPIAPPVTPPASKDHPHASPPSPPASTQAALMPSVHETPASAPVRIMLPWAHGDVHKFAGDVDAEALRQCGARYTAEPFSGVSTSVATESEIRCHFGPRPSKGASKAAAHSHVVLIDSIGKMTSDALQLGPGVARSLPELPPHALQGLSTAQKEMLQQQSPAERKVPIALWNVENWRGRLNEWGSKYRVRWLNLTDNSRKQFWSRFAFVASFEAKSQAFLSYASGFPGFDKKLASLRTGPMLACSKPSPKPCGAGGRGFSAMYVASNCHTKWPPPRPAIVDAAFDDIRGRGGDAGKVPRMRDRDTFIKELIHRGLQVVGYGACLNDAKRDMPEECKLRSKAFAKQCTASTHLFYIAFENSVYPDYVTEKVYHALAAGAIPIYYGAPNVADFLPASHMIVRASDFATPARLVEYLRRVAGNASAIAYYRSWRSRMPAAASTAEDGAATNWNRLVSRPNLCRVCDAAMRGPSSDGGAEPPVTAEEAFAHTTNQEPLDLSG